MERISGCQDRSKSMDQKTKAIFMIARFLLFTLLRWHGIEFYVLPSDVRIVIHAEQ